MDKSIWDKDLDSGGTTDNTTENYIPIKESDTFENSPLKLNTTLDRMESEKTFYAPTLVSDGGTVEIGSQLFLKDATGNLIFTRGFDSQIRIPTVVGFDETGTILDPFTTEFDPKVIREIIQPDATGENIGTELIYPVTSIDNQFIYKVYVKFGNTIPTAPLNFKVYVNSIAPENLVVDLDVETVCGPGVFSANTEFCFNLKPIVGILVGEMFYTVWSSTNSFSLKADVTNTTPWFAIDRQRGDIYKLMDERDVLELTNTTPYTPTLDYHPATLKSVQDLIATCSGFKGIYADLTALQTAYPTATLGDIATVTNPNGNLFYWNGSAWTDTGTGFLGDMLKIIYDPTGVNGNAFAMANMVENGINKILTATERTKLEGIEALAEVNQTDVEIKTQYENNPDTNAFSNAEKFNLLNQSGINTGDQNLSLFATKTQINNTTGYANYLDSSTSSSPRTYAMNTEAPLINDKTFPDGSRYPVGVTSYWDDINSKFTPDQADGNYAFSVNFNVDAVDRDKRLVVTFIAYGAGSGGSNIIVQERLVRLQKDAGEITPISLSFTTGITASIIASGVSVVLEIQDTAADIYDITCGLAKVGGVII